MVKKRKKRDVYEDPTDPDFPKQWYLVCNPFCNFCGWGLWGGGYANTFDVCFNIFQGARFYLIYFIGLFDFSLVFGIQALLLLCAHYQCKFIREI